MQVPSNDILRRRDEIRDYLSAGNVEKATGRFMDFTKEFYPASVDAAVLIKMDFSILKVEKNEGVIDDEKAGLKMRQIAKRILANLDEVMQNIAIEELGNLDPLAEMTVEQLEKALAEKIGKRKMPNDLVLQATNLIKEYPSTAFKLEVDSLELRLGQITGLIGENATGKTTLLQILAGELARDKGELRYPHFQKSKSPNWLQLKKQIAYVPQELPIWHGSLKDNLRYEAATHGIKGADNKKAVKYILERLGLTEHIEKSWSQLSGGYKLRFALAKAMVWQPGLLIIDEPLAFLDIKAQLVVLNDLQDLAKSLRNPMAIIISSQHLHEIEAVSDQLLFMRGGTMENLGDPAHFNERREYNLFELSCSLGYADFIHQLEGFPYQEVLFNGMTYIITSPLASTGYQLLDHLANKNVAIQYFRDISQSSKTKFYEGPF